MKDHNPNFSRLLPYYRREMSYLLDAGKRFSKAYPGVASGLDLGMKGSGDPHVQRLLESFAFLAGRLQLEVEEQHLHISTQLLSILYPDFVRPFPACTMMHLHNYQTSQPEGKRLPARTLLSSVSSEGLVCRFQTTMDTAVWPLEVEDVSYVTAQSYTLPKVDLRSPFLLKIDLRSTAGPLAAFNLDDLVFYLSGDTLSGLTFFRWLFAYAPSSSLPVLYQTKEGSALEKLPESALESVGFDKNSGLVPSTPQVGSVFRLMWDFFQFPQKFLFFRLKHLRSCFKEASGDRLSLFLPLANVAEPDKWPVSKNSILLNCVPAVNLFPKTSEPLHLDYAQESYRLVPDYRLEPFTEIHSLLKISSAADSQDEGEVIEPYFRYTHASYQAENRFFWTGVRTRTSLEGCRGTDLFVSFVDQKMNLANISDRIVYAHTLSTNRRLAESLPTGARFSIESGDATDIGAFMLLRPTRPLDPLLDGEIHWTMIHHLSLDFLGLGGDGGGIAALKEILQLYNRSDPSLKFAVEALEELRTERSVGFVKGFAWKSLAPLLSVQIKVDEKLGNSQGVFLLATLLAELVKMNAPFNTLAETRLFSTDGQLIKHWDMDTCTGHAL